jgi:hypothetical protein
MPSRNTKTPRQNLAGVATGLHAAGIFDCSNFLDEETLTLFAVQKLTDENTAADLPQKMVVPPMVGFYGAIDGSAFSPFAGDQAALRGFSSRIILIMA